MAQVWGVIMSKEILFWRTAFFFFFIRDIQCSVKTGFVSQGFLGELCSITSPTSMEGTKMVAKWTYQWKTERAHLLLKRGRLAALGTWPDCAYHTCGWRGSTVRCEMDWARGITDQDPHHLPSFNGVCSIPIQYISTGPVFSITTESQWRLRVLTHPGAPGNSPIPWDIPLQISVGNGFPKCAQAWCSQQHSL